MYRTSILQPSYVSHEWLGLPTCLRTTMENCRQYREGHAYPLLVPRSWDILRIDTAWEWWSWSVGEIESYGLAANQWRGQSTLWCWGELGGVWWELSPATSVHQLLCILRLRHWIRWWMVVMTRGRDRRISWASHLRCCLTLRGVHTGNWEVVYWETAPRWPSKPLESQV